MLYVCQVWIFNLNMICFERGSLPVFPFCLVMSLTPHLSCIWNIQHPTEGVESNLHFRPWHYPSSNRATRIHTHTHTHTHSTDWYPHRHRDTHIPLRDMELFRSTGEDGKHPPWVLQEKKVLYETSYIGEILYWYLTVYKGMTLLPMKLIMWLTHLSV